MENNEVVMDAELNTEVVDSNEQTDHIALNADGTQSLPAETGRPLSERDFKVAYAKALKERKDKIRQNKDTVADLQLEVAYWKAQADLLRHRFEKMDFFLKNLEIEPRYLAAIEEQKAKELKSSLDEKQSILD